METETYKNTLLRAASILMAVCALAAIVIYAVNTFSTINSLGNMTAEELDMVESQMGELGMSAGQAVSLISSIGYLGLALTAVFNVIKIVIGAVGFAKADKASTYFIASGIVFLVFGVLSLGGTFSPIGICNLLGGIAAPILFIIGGNQNKKQSHSA